MVLLLGDPDPPKFADVNILQSLTSSVGIANWYFPEESALTVEMGSPSAEMVVTILNFDVALPLARWISITLPGMVSPEAVSCDPSATVPLERTSVGARMIGPTLVSCDELGRGGIQTGFDEISLSSSAERQSSG